MEVMATAIPTVVGAARLRCTTRADGDFHADLVAPDELHRRQRAVVDLPWTFLDEVHGIEVVTVREPGQHTGARADAAVTDRAGAVLGVWVGDCAPVALVAPSGVIGAAHAGWRGVRAGVLPATVAAMRRLGATEVAAHVGPCIGPECYEFGAADLDDLRQRFGPDGRGHHGRGRARARHGGARGREPGRGGRGGGIVGSVHGVRRPVLVASGPRRPRAPGHGRVAGGRVVMVVDIGVVGDRLVELRRRIAAAGGDDVTVVAVTKGFGPEVVEAAVAVGLDDIGENYAQELLAKLAGLGEDRPRVHFIGRLQSNKVRSLAGVVDLWQSIDRASLVEPLAKLRPPAKRAGAGERERRAGQGRVRAGRGGRAGRPAARA